MPAAKDDEPTREEPIPSCSSKEPSSEEEEEEVEDGSELGSENDSDAKPEYPLFDTDDVAKMARDVGVKAYNAGNLDAALKVQYGILKHFCERYGEKDPRCGLYYLDYGVTVLAMIQSANFESAALAGNTGEENEDVETCFQTLSLALSCFERAEDTASDEELPLIQSRQAEVREALAQLFHERELEQESLQELELALLLRKEAIASKPGAVAGVMLQIGVLYMRNEDYDKAEEILQEAVDLAKERHLEVAELEEFLTEAKEMKANGGMGATRDAIRELFAEGPIADGPTDETDRHLISALPAGLSTARPMEVSAGQLLPPRETSSSMSFFPRQSTTGTPAAPVPGQAVNTAVAVKRKPRPTKEEGPAVKRNRSEASN